MTKEEFLKSRKSYSIDELIEERPDVYEKILNSEMDEKHKYLNKLMD